MSRIDRTHRSIQARPTPRIDRNRSEEAGGGATVSLPVPVSPVATVRSFREERRGADAELVVQILGQHGERRGLRAGPTAAEAARAAYNRVEWSGSYDRRARVGRQTRTVI